MQKKHVIILCAVFVLVCVVLGIANEGSDTMPHGTFMRALSSSQKTDYIERKLEEKYNKKFEVSELADRMSDGENLDGYYTGKAAEDDGWFFIWVDSDGTITDSEYMVANKAAFDDMMRPVLDDTFGDYDLVTGYYMERRPAETFDTPEDILAHDATIAYIHVYVDDVSKFRPIDVNAAAEKLDFCQGVLYLHTNTRDTDNCVYVASIGGDA